MTPPDSRQRFDLMFRVQHGILFVSVLIAIVTGLPMKFPDAWLSQTTVTLLGGVEARAWLHRGAGLVMVGLGLFHWLWYVLLDRRIPFYRRGVVPTPQDATHLVQHVKYNLGLADSLPRMGRYTWFEKFDYIGVTWGIAVMGLTGLPMLFMDQALRFIPLSWLQALWAAHSEEAMLATLFLLAIHMYNTHFSPERFPMSLTWWHGRISQEDMEKYHPLELEAIEAREDAPDQPGRDVPARAGESDAPPTTGPAADTPAVAPAAGPSEEPPP